MQIEGIMKAPVAMTLVDTRESTMAPVNSKMMAMITACRMVRVREPTDVAKALATSLEPVANPKAKAANAPITRNHS
jgi:hypothetical protein